MKSVLPVNPVFNPSSKTLSFSGISGFTNNRLMVVVNQTKNAIIYAESVDGLGGTWDANGKTLTLAFDTTSHSANDLLQVIYDAPSMTIVPQEEYFDPVNKSRVSQPQSLIDTDFEYGLQSTKWEFVQLVNNKPTVFYDPTSPFLNVALSGNGSRTVLLTAVTPVSGLPDNSSGFAALGLYSGIYGTNTPIYVQDATDPNANGFYVAERFVASPYNTANQVSNGAAYTYNTRNTVVSGNILDPTKTLVFPCNFYTGSSIAFNPLSGVAFSNPSPLPGNNPSGLPSLITCTTISAHNLYPGNLISIANLSAGSFSPPPTGSFVVFSTPNTRAFTINVTGLSSGPLSAVGIGAFNRSNSLTIRPAGYSVHRAFDGGVQFTCGPYTPNAQKIRQTRRYFRYQSGKGIQFSTGTVLKPNFSLDQVTYSSGVVTVNTKYPHGMVPGCQIYLSGAAQSEYNGVFTVASAPTDLSFTYNIAGTPSSPASASGPFIIGGANSWYNGTVRVGLFDQQNGAFFEFDGQTLYAVRRNSTYQLIGTINVNNGESLVTGNNTRFADQLRVGDFIVIKGSSYRVTSVISQTQILISPEYRGVSIVSPAVAVVSKTIDTKIPQSSWNIDKFDGTGPSGYTVDLTKMQMLYIDYSWYGAGFIRWGMRSTNGNVSYCHKLVNNNTNTEAYFRSGNLPARYEVNSYPSLTFLTSTLGSSDSTMNVVDTSNFPSSGILRVTDSTTFPAGSAAIEYISYTGKTSTTFTGLGRGQTGGSPATSFTYSPNAQDTVELASLTTTNPVISGSPAGIISHWGSSVIMDGRFDNDLSYSFNAGNVIGTAVNSGARNAILSLRLAPTVDNGKTGSLGTKEVINRMQLKLQAMDIGYTGTGLTRVELNLNGKIVTPTGTTLPSWQNVGGSSLAQIAYYTSTAAVSVVGGETIYGFFASNPRQSEDLTQVRDLGNCILGGGISNFVSSSAFDMYPDGPDVIHVLATPIGVNLTGTNAIQSRISWTEAQA